MSAHASASPTALRWVTVFQGSYGAALAAQAAIEGAGIPTYLPDVTLKLLDPFITGGNALVVSVQVPSDVAARAADIVASSAASSTSVAPAPELTGAAADRARLRALGLRVCFASLAILLAPLALCWAVTYFRETRRLGLRPENHAWVVFATAVAATACIGIPLMLAGAPGAWLFHL